MVAVFHDPASSIPFTQPATEPLGEFSGWLLEPSSTITTTKGVLALFDAAQARRYFVGRLGALNGLYGRYAVRTEVVYMTPKPKRSTFWSEESVFPKAMGFGLTKAVRANMLDLNFLPFNAVAIIISIRQTDNWPVNEKLDYPYYGLIYSRLAEVPELERSMLRYLERL